MLENSLRTRTLAALTLLAAVGCGASELPKQCDRTEAITLHVHPAIHLNPDRAGLPRSVVLRLYQLDDARDFRASSFDRLWTSAAGGGGRPDQLIALPGRNQAHALRRNPRAQYLAVAANFRERRGESNWRALVRLPAPHNPCQDWPGKHAAPVELTLSDYALQLR